jgi:hypothetical protein
MAWSATRTPTWATSDIQPVQAGWGACTYSYQSINLASYSHSTPLQQVSKAMHRTCVDLGIQAWMQGQVHGCCAPSPVAPMVAVSQARLLMIQGHGGRPLVRSPHCCCRPMNAVSTGQVPLVAQAGAPHCCCLENAVFTGQVAHEPRR